MMLSEEPYRWAEAIANRRDYIEDQLRRGSPVVGVGYEDGVALLTMGQGQQKLFEVYDRIALGSIGHSTDIENLRNAAIEMAHTLGFNYSEEDVTLRQIVHFGLGPAMKAGFDEVVRSPYLARILLTELDGMDGTGTFYTVDYDGAFQKREGWAVLGGFPEADQVMEQHFSDLEVETLSLQDALSAALKAWAAGRWAGAQDTLTSEEGDLEEADFDVAEVLRTEFEIFEVEAAVLEQSRKGKSKYRALGAEDLAPVLDPYREKGD